jgi:hypothetical protein
MRADHRNTEQARPRGTGALCKRALVRLLVLAVMLASVTGAGAVTAGSAFANSYNGLLYSGNLTILAGSQNESGGFVYGDDSWAAPSGSTFGGFAYTGGAFYSDTSDSVGAISAGFGGDGSANQPTYLFPWTTDCAVSNVGHYWAYSAGGVLAGTNGNSQCSTSGSTGGWNYVNSEDLNTNVSDFPGSDYSTLWLTVFCQAGTCKYAGNATNAAYASVTNLSGNFNDSYNQPSGGISWDGLSGSWVQTNSGNVSLSASATDPDGVCSMQANLSGPENLSTTLGNQNPGVTNVGGAIGTEFAYGTNPCWVGQTDSGSWTLPAGLLSGSYAASLQASNPGNYEAQGFSAGGAPTVSSTGSVSIDDQTPSVQLLSPTGSGGWTSNRTATIDVSTGPSGLSSLACTDNGSGDGATLQSSNDDSYVYTVPISSGTNDLSCSAANGDANGALIGSSGTQLYQQDSVVPSVTFTDTGYDTGTWTADAQTITVTATGGPSGISGLSCTLDGNALPDSDGDTDIVGAAGSTQTASVTVPANGAHDLACNADNAGIPSIVGSGSYQVDVDAQVPMASFLTGSGYAATSTQASDPQTASGQNWLNGANTITIGVTGTEPTVESGVQTITCTINGDSADALTLTNVPTSGTIAANTPFSATFVAGTASGWIDGQNAVACQSTTVAGLSGADGQNVGTSSIEYVDVNDASWPKVPGEAAPGAPTTGQCGISSVIDNGGCAYSDGPSQTTWYASAQTVRITADDTGAAAPITSITCTGATMPVSSWSAAADPQDVDSDNGMTVTATLEAPGGKLDCSASDSASPIDSYELGTYNVSIDPDPPIGHFDSQGANGAAQNILQLDVSSPGGSGIKQVAVEGKDENTGKLYAGGQLTGNPADGTTAYATLDPATGTYDLTIDPSVFPGLDDKVAFTATPETNAGLKATLTTTASGSSEVLTPIQLGQNPNPGLVLSTNGDATAITATARAGKWSAASVTQTGLPASLNASPSSPVAPATVATVARWSRSVCKPAKKKSSKPARKTTKGKPARKTPKRSCRTLTTKAPPSEALPANYAQKLELTGTLTDTTTNTPVAGGAVLIYTTNLANGVVHLADTTKTGPRGRFSYRLPAGPNRRVDLVYTGTDSTKGIDSAFDATTAGKLRVRATRTVRIGQNMRITGRILGGSIDGKGALVQMWYLIQGETRTWDPFKPGRSNPRGGFVIRYPITPGDKGLTYRVRIKVPTQAGWGFRGATSNVLRFHVA